MTYRGAIISDCGRYRYRLERRVSSVDRIALFIMLNPSTADAENDDPTIRRCIGFTESFGCGRLVVANLFAFRTKSPAEMFAASDPIGPDNDWHINECAVQTRRSNGIVICAWGAHGFHLGRDAAITLRLLRAGCDPQCLGQTAKGLPRHPLYLPRRCVPMPYRRLL